MLVDREKLKKLAERATQGEWLNDEGEITCSTSLIAQVMTPSDFPCAGEEEDGIADELEANAEFVAAANPSTILALLAQLEAAEADIAKLEVDLDEQDTAVTRLEKLLNESAAALRTLREAGQREIDFIRMYPKEYREKYHKDYAGDMVIEQNSNRAALAAALAAEGGK